MPVVPASLLAGLEVQELTPVSGGSIAAAYRVDTPDGPVFAKVMPATPEGIAERESAGLAALRAAGALHVPEVLRTDPAGLLLEWVDIGPADGGDDADLGRRLAALHAVRGPRFGSLDDDPRGFVGSVPVDLSPADTWAESYLHHRVQPLAARCVRRGLLDHDVLGDLDRVTARADDLCGPPEQPSLVHGDLWSGNRLVDTAGRHWLVDPAASWSHRELDLAMMRLFGGFGEETFTAYQEVAPLADGWQQRVDLHQLLPLFVHVLLYGGGYAGQVVRALGRLGR